MTARLSTVITVDEEVVRSGVHPVHQHRIVRPSGEVRTVQSVTSKLWKTTHVGAEDGISREHNRLFGTVQDITELKQAEEASHALSRDLQESKDWLEEAQRVAHLGYWVWDLETNQVIWSDETYRIFGLVPKAGSFDVSVVGEMMHPDDREAVFLTAKKAIDTETRADCEHIALFRVPMGKSRISPQLGRSQEKFIRTAEYQMFGTTQDITDRKRAEGGPAYEASFTLSEGAAPPASHSGSWASNALGIRWSHIRYWTIYRTKNAVYKILWSLIPAVRPPIPAERFLDATQHVTWLRRTVGELQLVRKMQSALRGRRLLLPTKYRIHHNDGSIRFLRDVRALVGVPVYQKAEYVGVTMDDNQTKACRAWSVKIDASQSPHDIDPGRCGERKYTSRRRKA